MSIQGTLSDRFNLNCGVPRGSCLGPLLFTIYASRLFDIIEYHLTKVHCYADDTQLYLSFRPDDTMSRAAAVAAMESCIRDIRQWMLHDRLMLNDTKSAFLIIGTRQQLNKGASQKSERIVRSAGNTREVHWEHASVPPGIRKRSRGTELYAQRNVRLGTREHTQLQERSKGTFLLGTVETATLRQLRMGRTNVIHCVYRTAAHV